MRQHVPSNEVTAGHYAPIYHNTRDRMESVFGRRSERLWPDNEDTCSKCYSLTPAVATSATS